MKKFLVVALCSLALSGCASVQSAVQGVEIATTSVANPVTKRMLYDTEAAVNAAVVGLVQYRRACLAGHADANCRAHIVALQVYTRKIPPVLKSLRTFVKNNDQVNAIVAYNTIQSLLANFKAQAASVGQGA